MTNFCNNNVAKVVLNNKCPEILDLREKLFLGGTMKEIVIALLGIVTILITLALCKASSESDKMLEHLNELNTDDNY